MKTKTHKIVFAALSVLFVIGCLAVIFFIGKSIVNAVENEELIYCNKLRRQSIQHGDAFFYADWEKEMCGIQDYE
jgi:hypothetical protein